MELCFLFYSYKLLHVSAWLMLLDVERSQATVKHKGQSKWHWNANKTEAHAQWECYVRILFAWNIVFPQYNILLFANHLQITFPQQQSFELKHCFFCIFFLIFFNCLIYFFSLGMVTTSLDCQTYYLIGN